MCYNRWDKGSQSREGFETKLLLKRIDGAIQVRSNVDPTFYSLVGFGQSRGITRTYLFLIIHSSLISHLIMYLYRLRTTRSPLSFWGDGGIIPFEPFFHTFPRGLEKATINRIFLILPSQKEEREILFPFLRDQEIGSS
ncbi:hypothetical protein ERO13_D07G151450v2, partial [Gossypium hirsutum]